MGISAALGSSALLPAGLGFRNLIINGDMRIDQRNSGASFTVVNATYGLDRWAFYSSSASKLTSQRLTTTPPVGFAYYQRITSSAATADTAGAYYTAQQIVEGFSTAQLSWGTANAKPVVLSFWVRSSLTGTFGGGLRNAGGGGYYSYAFTYTINVANTWEYKTVFINGSTGGSWDSSNGAGIYMFFDLGTNATDTQTAGSWTNSNKLAASGCVRLVGTSAATLDLTGVQLEANYSPTPFEHRPIGVELALCQRYFYSSYSNGVAINGADTISGHHQGIGVDTASIVMSNGTFAVPMRATPTVNVYQPRGGVGANSVRNHTSGGTDLTGMTVIGVNNRGLGYIGNTGNVVLGYFYGMEMTASAEL